VWSKAIINAGINPLGAILAVPNGMIIADEFSAFIQDAIIREAVAAAVARGIPLDAEAMVAAARDVCVKTSANLCSMLQDIQARRRTEIDSINGSIIESGVRYGVPVPVNRTMYGLIRAKELQYLNEKK
jgi:2-dehydropantoate 2-reductase